MRQRFFWLLTVMILTYSSSAVAEQEPKAHKRQPNQFYYQQFQEIFELVNKQYVQEPDRQKMADAAIEGMLSSLDCHSAYFVDEDSVEFLHQTKGEFGGIGIEIRFRKDKGAIQVITPIDDLPAYKAGIKSGDYIVGINSELVSTLGFPKALKAMRGEPGTKVTLLIVKAKEPKPVEIELTRQIVQVNPVKAHLEKKNIAYIRIAAFTQNTIIDLKKAFKKLEDTDEIRGIILDLRDNPGGLLTQAISVSEYFLESGIIVSTKGRVNGSTKMYPASRFVAKAPKVPMIVIINGGSASASEIVAGSLQDHKRAIILGNKSYGKSSVQSMININSRAVMKLTTAQYYTPNGRLIETDGIEPDIMVEQIDMAYGQQKAEEKRFSELYLKKYLKKKSHDDKSEPSSSPDEKNKLPSKKNPHQAELSDLYKKDYQFARAYDLIIGLTLGIK